jgi:hypothetical protein
MDMSEKSFGSIDRRWIYALSALVILIPLIRPLGLPVAVSPESEQAYEAIEKLQSGSVVLVSFDYQPANTSQMGPLAKVLLQILDDMNVKAVTMSSFADSATYPEAYTEATYGKSGKEYGVDYVNLGYYAGSEASLAAFCEDVGAVFKADFRGNPLSSLPLMKDIKSIKDLDMMIAVNSTSGGQGTNVEMTVRQVNIANGLDLLVATSSVSAAQNMVYLQSGNIVGLLAGLNGAAELETIIEKPGEAVAGMDALTTGHLMIVVFLILGNIGHFLERARSAKEAK